MPKIYAGRAIFLREFTKELIVNSQKLWLQERVAVRHRAIPETLGARIPLARLMQPRLRTLQIKPKDTRMTLQEVVQPIAAPIPQGFDLGKIYVIIRDPRVTAIECPGPGQPVLIKIFGKTSLTRISLNQQEIQQIIDSFSRETKIPVISGLFKAAVGNLVISAVISDLVGTRFLITRIMPMPQTRVY